MAGYSGTPLAERLGVKEGHRVGVFGDPGHFGELVDPLPAGAELISNPRSACDIYVVFAPDRQRFVDRLAKLITKLEPDASVWISWPKRTSGVATDMIEDVVREVALPLHLVDIKVCAVDDTWSGLKLVVRTEHRAAWPDRVRA
ncbi:MAG: DUF3052 domain-containing protein [Acidimicrobiia bacterium]|nr:DUF3052 domain-containing protein [Acidimicrobiia bacterium]